MDLAILFFLSLVFYKFVSSPELVFCRRSTQSLIPPPSSTSVHEAQRFCVQVTCSSGSSRACPMQVGQEELVSPTEAVVGDVGDGRIGIGDAIMEDGNNVEGSDSCGLGSRNVEAMVDDSGGLDACGEATLAWKRRCVLNYFFKWAGSIFFRILQLLIQVNCDYKQINSV
jgi:hypothetical protein